MRINIGNVIGYDTRTNLLAASLSNAFTGVNAIARLVPDKRQLQNHNYKHLLKEYYNSMEIIKPTKKTVIFSEIKKWGEEQTTIYNNNAQYISSENAGLFLDSFI